MHVSFILHGAGEVKCCVGGLKQGEGKKNTSSFLIHKLISRSFSKTKETLNAGTEKQVLLRFMLQYFINDNKYRRLF